MRSFLKIVNLLKESDKRLTRTEIRDLTRADYETVKIALDYLTKDNKVKKTTKNKIIYYEWK